MKRLFSITTMLVLLCSAFSPAWATDMDGMQMQGASCHRMSMQDVSGKHNNKHGKTHHCEGMEMTAAQPSNELSFAPSHSHSCPMNCCVQGNPKSGVAISANSFLPPLATVEAELDFAYIIFVSAGFSSHTDRGPPAE
jgi:hypothetical protein